MKIAALTLQNDLHTYVVKHELRIRHGIELSLIEVDRLSTTHKIDWIQNSKSPECRIVVDGRWISLNDLDVVWWRRTRAQQVLDGKNYPAEQEDVINSDCRSSILGGFTTCFSGHWISNPWNTERAGNKPYQLSVASTLGFRTPATLISQDPESVRSFLRALPARKAIVKPVAGGGRGLFLFTQFVTESDLGMTDSISVCPAIYQEYIEGTRHIRLNCFGDRSFAAEIISEDLDWRPNLNVPVATWIVPDDLHKRIRLVLDNLGLEMGIVDLKQTPQGELVWLEVNPQGQFLFLEPLTGDPYSRIFTDYLASSLLQKVSGRNASRS